MRYVLREELYHGNVFCVSRAELLDTGEEFVIKHLVGDYPRPEDIASIKYEYSMLKELMFDNVVKARELINLNGNPALVEENIEGRSLKQWMADGPIETKDALHILVQVAKALLDLHSRNIIHKGINPSNIIWNPLTGVVKLIDFSKAIELPEEKLEITHFQEIENSIAYVSPEQTGRLNRGLNYRTDFYSLGITFFEMMTGKLPFQSDDPMELLHFQIAKEPPLASSINSSVPQVISKIILKCMQKGAENRYQTAYGILHDLALCQKSLQEKGKIDDFEIAQKDYLDQLNFTGELYGREKETKILMREFDKVKVGPSELFMLAGYSGVGKTALVFEMRDYAAAAQGFFVQGKCDQFKKDIPYFPLIEAIKQLMQKILASGGSHIDEWKERILKAVGNNGKVIIDVIPVLEKIIGEQPAVPELSPVASQARFEYTMMDFLKSLSTPEQPLVIFIDDLQWADSSLLKLLALLFHGRNEFNQVLVIGAYRNNEVDATHPLMLTLKKIEKSGREIPSLNLLPLEDKYVREWIGSILREFAEYSASLANIIFEKTLGNAFFIIQVLKDLKSKGILSFNFDKGHWDWNIGQIQQLGISDNVVDLMIERIRKLSPESLKLIQLASCIGNRFDLRLLAIANKSTLTETMEQMQEILQAGFILPIDNSYKYLVEEGTDPIMMRFLHDRVQQASHSTLDEKTKKQLHYDIGRLLLTKVDKKKLEEQLLDIVDHLNYGIELIKDEKEKMELVQLNLRAGQKANLSNAYDFADQILDFAIKLLPEDAWTQHPELTGSLYLEAARASLLSLQNEKATALVQNILDNTKDKLTMIQAYKLKIMQYNGDDKLKEAANTTLDVFKLADFPIQDPPTKWSMKAALWRVKLAMRGKKISELEKLPKLKDPIIEELIEVAASASASMYLSRPEMFVPLFAQAAKLSIKYGNCASACLCYVNYGLSLTAVKLDFTSAYEFGSMALKMQHQIGSYENRAFAIFMYSYFISHWKRPIVESIDLLLEGYQSGMELGEAEGAAWCLHGFGCNNYFMGKNLEEVREFMTHNAGRIRNLNQKAIFYLHELTLQAVLNLIGDSKGRTKCEFNSFEDEKEKLKEINQNDVTLLCKTAATESSLCYIFEELEEGLQRSNRAKEILYSIPGSPFSVPYYVYRTLIMIGLLPKQSEAGKKQFMKEIDENLAILDSWSQSAPMNYRHKYALCLAEKSRIMGNLEEAEKFYQESIQGARNNGFQNEEAIALEVYGRFFLSQNNEQKAKEQIVKARDAYLLWGAKAKIAELEAKYRNFFIDSTEAGTAQLKTSAGKMRIASEQLDLGSAMKAVSLISAEIQLDKLIPKMLNVMLENAGAQRAVLIEKQKEGWLVAATAKLEAGYSDFHMITEPLNSTNVDLPKKLISYVQRAEEVIVLGDAMNDERFSTDEYIQKTKAKSLLCMPIMQKDELIAIVLLENNLTTYVFTQDRIQILQMLGSQAAISIENAQHFEVMQNLYRSTERFVPKPFLQLLNKQHIEDVKLGDCIKTDLTVLFTDIRDYTTITEGQEPEEAYGFINSYLKVMAPIIRSHHGFINQYQGDGIMALFPGEASEAVAAVIEMSKALVDFNAAKKSAKFPSIQVGYALNTGSAMLGTIGEEERMDANVISDAINLASRVEGLNKFYGTRFLISDTTLKALSDPTNYLIRVVDKVQVKGKKKAIHLYEVSERGDHVDPSEIEFINQYEMAFKAYEKGDIALALKGFKECEKLKPEDKASIILGKRCEDLLQNGLPKEWDGTYRMLSK